MDNIIGATYDDHQLTIIDDGWGDCLVIFGHEFGPTHLVRAGHFGDAWEAWLDEQPTIDADDIPEAYGLYILPHSDRFKLTGKVELRDDVEDTSRVYLSVDKAKAAIADLFADEDNPRDLIEGYEYQSNFTGTGIVNVGHYVWTREVTPDDPSLTLTIEDG